MIYLIIGTITSLAGIVLLVNKMSLLGILLLIVGVAVGLKGRRDIDKTS